MIPISRKLMIICFLIFFIPMLGWYFLVDYSEAAKAGGDIDLAELTNDIRVKLSFVLVFGLILLGVILYYLKSEIINPLSHLTEKAKIARDDYSPEDFQSERSDEIGTLSNTLYLTLSRLEEKITLISEFSSNLTHEFKLPLSSVRGSIELLIDGADKDEEDRNKFYANILRETERLDRMITELIEITKLDNDPDIFQKKPEDYLHLLNTIIEDFKPLAAQKKIRIDKKLLRGIPKVTMDKDKITQVIVNILDNAISFSEQNGKITVSVEISGKEVLTQIADEGKGISEDIRKKIFNRFFTTRKELNNTGIGLSIAKMIVEKHRGTITVQPNTPRGTAFEISLPL